VLFLYLNRRSQQATGGLQVQAAESRTRCVDIAGQCKCILEANVEHVIIGSTHLIIVPLYLFTECRSCTCEDYALKIERKSRKK